MLRNEQSMSVHLANALGKLKKDILALVTLAEEQVSQALRAFTEQDKVAAQQSIDRDSLLDKMELELEEECLKVLALHQPVAHDLRFVVAALKLTNDLERIGDYGVHIAERAISLGDRNDIQNVLDLAEMGKKVLVILRQSIDALINQDVVKARKIWAAEQEIDAYHADNFRRIEMHVKANPERAGSLLQLLSVSRYLERISDLATNIADDVIYMVEGRMPHHRRE